MYFHFLFVAMKKLYHYFVYLVLLLYCSFILLIQVYDQGYFKSDTIQQFKENYALPFFEQNWSMFSPNPPMGNHYFLVQFCTATQKSDLIDIQKLIRLRSYSSFFSIDQRLKKYFSGCFNDIITLQRNNIKIQGNPHISQGLESIVNYSKFVFQNQADFQSLIQPHDSVFIKLFLVDEQLNTDIHLPKTYTTIYTELDKIFLTQQH
ncbi:Uncharacterised protein [Myroides odoratus]|uniref:Transmembrane protein n=2 Tax=Myroides odoratus TaxID=256 RepID=A0A9Q7EB94_MYROD|nr:hypothetical protein Myrod_2902 [Myroides odoratus DSM 2801]EKB04283.1 hypothetical protein HMPREF9716_03195 [Myroides odoratus CIP 103059]QQU01039.1 hypothetical protein I6I88_04595 [Myroides odoratus]STZ30999.1 Uncharacterised protein [Myroides odoratus]